MNPIRYKNQIIISVGPVSIQIIVCVIIMEYIPIPIPFFNLDISPKNIPINNICIVRPI